MKKEKSTRKKSTPMIMGTNHTKKKIAIVPDPVPEIEISTQQPEKKTVKRVVVGKKRTIKDQQTVTTPNNPIQKPPKKPRATKSDGHYVSKKDLLAAVLESKELGRMSNNLAIKLQLLTSRYAKHPWFARYTYNDDMQAYAMMMLVRTWHAFNPEKSDNPFAFYTQCIKNSFQQYKNQEKRQRTIRDELIVDQGLTPSYNYQMEYDAELRHQLQEEHEVQVRYERDAQSGYEEDSEY